MKLKKSLLIGLVAALCGFSPLLAQASELNGLALTAIWALPFVGMLLSIAPVAFVNSDILASSFW